MTIFMLGLVTSLGAQPIGETRIATTPETTPEIVPEDGTTICFSEVIATDINTFDFSGDRLIWSAGSGRIGASYG